MKSGLIGVCQSARSPCCLPDCRQSAIDGSRLGTAEMIPGESEQVAPHEPLEVLQLLDVVLEDVGADDIQVI